MISEAVINWIQRGERKLVLTRLYEINNIHNRSGEDRRKNSFLVDVERRKKERRKNGKYNHS